MCGIHLDRQDPFAEVDLWVNYRMQETPQNLVIRAFGRHDITLHIDDGCMGGGEEFKGDPKIQSDAYYYFYKVAEAHFSTSRLGVFHHAYISSLISNNGVLGLTFASPDDVSDGDDIFIIGNEIRDIASDRDDITEDVLLAHVFMHELGHNLGLVPEGFKPVPFEGIDSYYYASYRSCMNYNISLIELIDYSDGSRRTTSGGHDFDDWGHIRLRRVATKWDVVE